MAKEKKGSYAGIRVEEIDDVHEEKDLTPKEASFSLAAEALEESVDKAFQEGPLKAVTDTIQSSHDNAFRQVGRVEVKTFDAAFLEAVEHGLEAIGRIIANPRTFIKETQEIVNVEKAKKVSVASIQHFATHSQYLRSIEDNGEVIPDRILTIHSETNTAIYENRFVMTLIKRTLSFVEQRNTFIKEHGETLDSDELFVHSKTNFGGVDYEVSMRVKASIPSSDAGESEKNNSLLRRLDDCQGRCMDYLHSNFMNQMKGAKDITSPVHMTNMLLKHPDYHAAYELWEFIDQYDSLGVSYEVKENADDFDEEYLQSLYKLIAQAMLKLRTRHFEKANAESGPTSKKITPTIIFGLDEVGYEDSRFLYDAYPDARPADYDPTALITQEEREEARDKRLAKATNQEIAQIRLKKAVTKDKDRTAFNQAKRRNEQKSALEAEVAEEREKEKARKQAEAAERARKAREAKAKKQAQEEALYEEKKKKYTEGGGKK